MGFFFRVGGTISNWIVVDIIKVLLGLPSYYQTENRLKHNKAYF